MSGMVIFKKCSPRQHRKKKKTHANEIQWGLQRSKAGRHNPQLGNCTETLGRHDCLSIKTKTKPQIWNMLYGQKPTFDFSMPGFFSTSVECVELCSGSESLLEFISWGSTWKASSFDTCNNTKPCKQNSFLYTHSWVMLMMFVWRLTQPQGMYRYL